MSSIESRRLTLDEYDYFIRERGEYSFIYDDRGSVVGTKDRVITLSLTFRSDDAPAFGVKRRHSEGRIDVWIGFLPFIALHWRERTSWKALPKESQ